MKTTRFRNNLYQVRSKPKVLESQITEKFWDQEYQRALLIIANIGNGHISMMEENLRFNVIFFT
jgi:hypothetical protein